MRVRLQFERVVVKATRRWKDPVTGKPRQLTRTFEQTINPWNKNEHGEPKDREEIMEELKLQRDVWLQAPLEYVAEYG